MKNKIKLNFSTFSLIFSLFLGFLPFSLTVSNSVVRFGQNRQEDVTLESSFSKLRQNHQKSRRQKFGNPFKFDRNLFFRRKNSIWKIPTVRHFCRTHICVGGRERVKDFGQNIAKIPQNFRACGALYTRFWSLLTTARRRREKIWRFFIENTSKTSFL